MRVSAGQRHRFAVTELGPVAVEVLCRNGEARIAAVFEQSFYLETAGMMACIGTVDLGPGPLNATSTAPPGTNWRASGLRDGERIILSGDTVRIGRLFVFEPVGARRWRPAGVPETWSASSLCCGLECLDALTRDRVPEDGLGRLTFRSGAAHAGSLVLRRAVQPVEILRAWLEPAMQCEAGIGEGRLDGVEALVGLGPGLTPSGDDFLGGIMIALHALRSDRAVKCLATAVARSMTDRTTPISAAHLGAAMRGMGSASMHEMLRCLMSGDETSIGPTLTAVDKIGHTSGWDCLAGMAMTLQAWRDAELSTPSRGSAAGRRAGSG